MADFVRLNSDRAEIEPDCDILREEDYIVALHSDEVLAQAQAEADRIVKAAHVEFEAQKKAGYEQGLAEASGEVAKQMFALVSSSVDYLETAENQVAEIVLVCLRKISTDYSDEDLVIGQARTALLAARSEPRVTLRVRPELEDGVRDRIGEILARNGDVNFLEVVADPHMQPGGCRLESDAGVVDAGLDVQLAALERALLRRDVVSK